jgi:cysteine desulfurase/selenocysteine lyase
MDLKAARQQFPALGNKVFLDAACVSLAPRTATAAIEKFLDMALLCPEASSTLHHIAMDEMRSQARPIAAKLLNAREDEVALVESTTQGLSLAAQALPLERGDRVMLCDLEFMQVAIPWCQLQDRAGIEIDVVASRGGQVTAEDFAARITPRTRVLAISNVQWSSGFRADLNALSKLCKDRGLWLVVDAIQQLGAVPIDVQATRVDVLTCGGHKWLNSPFGTGFLYLRHEIQPRLRPPLAGYLSLDPPEGGWGNYFQTPSIRPVREYAFATEARRYEAGGTGNYPGAIGLAASLQLILDLGQERIADHIRGLTDQLIAGLDRQGVEVVTPRAPASRAGIVTFTLGQSQQNVALMEHLLARKILVSVRYTSNVGGVRVSCHFFNSAEDLERLLEGVGDFLRGKSQ